MSVPICTVMKWPQLTLNMLSLFHPHKDGFYSSIPRRDGVHVDQVARMGVCCSAVTERCSAFSRRTRAFRKITQAELGLGLNFEYWSFFFFFCPASAPGVVHVFCRLNHWSLGAHHLTRSSWWLTVIWLTRRSDKVDFRSTCEFQKDEKDWAKHMGVFLLDGRRRHKVSQRSRCQRMNC